jgi:hypothetical protein
MCKHEWVYRYHVCVHTHTHTYTHIPESAKGVARRGFLGTCPPDGGFDFNRCCMAARNSTLLRIARIFPCVPSSLRLAPSPPAPSLSSSSPSASRFVDPHVGSGPTDICTTTGPEDSEVGDACTAETLVAAADTELTSVVIVLKTSLSKHEVRTLNRYVSMLQPSREVL